ncbi:MAG TPA: VWA domain-containing protein [Phycisphaerae bacterium]
MEETQARVEIPLPGSQPAVIAADPHEGRTLVLSWLISAAVHVLLFMILFLTPWIVGRETQEGGLLVARTELLSGPDADALSPSPQVASMAPETADVPDVVPRPQEMTPVTAVGPGRGDSGGTAGRVIGIGTGGGDFGKFGIGVGSSGGGATFFKVGGKARGARNIVYVVDHSGSMLATFDAVRDELMRSINALRRGQKFHLILFNNQALEKPPKALVPAIESQKQAALEFLRTVEPQGSTNPIPAMQRAFELHPDLIFFLTDGDFDPELLDRLRQWNKDKKVRVSTIAYLSLSGKPLLERIARENNGEFRFVSEQELP